MLSDLISKENLRKLMSRYHNKIDDKNNDSIVKCNNCNKNKAQCFTPEERSIKINYCTTNQVVKPQSYCPKSEVTSKQIHTKCNNSTCPYTTESISSTKADDTNRFRLTNSKPTKCHSKNCPNLHPSTVGSNLTCLSATSSYTKWQIGSSKQSQSTCAQTSCIDNSKLHSSIPDTPLILDEPISLSSINEYFRKQYGADKVAIVLIKNPNKTDCSTKDDIRIIESPLQTKITCKQDKFTAKIEQKEPCNKSVCKSCDNIKKYSPLQPLIEDFDFDAGYKDRWETCSSNQWDTASSSGFSKLLGVESFCESAIADEPISESSIKVKKKSSKTNSNVKKNKNIPKLIRKKSKTLPDKSTLKQSEGSVKENREFKFLTTVTLPEEKHNTTENRNEIKPKIKKEPSPSSMKETQVPFKEIPRNSLSRNRNRKISNETISLRSSSLGRTSIRSFQPSISVSKCREPDESNKKDNQPRVSALQKFSCENQQPVPHVCAAKRYMDETRRSKSQISFDEIQSFHKIQSGTPESRTSCKCPASRALIQPALKISVAQNNRDESVEKQSTKSVTKIKISDENKTQDKTSARSSSPKDMLEIQVTSSKTDESISSPNKIMVCQAPCAVSQYKIQSETSSKQGETDSLKRMPSPKSSNKIRLADSVSKYKRPDEIDSSRRNLSPTYKFPASKVSKEFQPLSSATKNKTQDETSSRRSSSPKNIDKISPTNSKIKFKKSDETNSLRRSPSQTCKCPASQSSSYKTEKFQPTSNATKNKTQDQTSSRRSSPKNIKELRSTISVTKYKSLDENGSSRRSPSPKSLHSVRSTSRSSPKNTNEVRLKSSPTKYKKSDKTDSSRRSPSPKNINKVRSTNSPTKYKRPSETLSRGSISSQYAKNFKMRFSSSKNRSDDINSTTKSSLLRFNDPAESNFITNDSGTSRIVRHKEFQSNASIYLGSSSLHSNINEKQSIESRSKYKRADETSSSIKRSSPKNTNVIRPTVSEVKYKRPGKTDSSRSASPENTDKVQSKISPTKYRKLNESELSGSSTKNKKLNKIDLMHRSSSPIDIDNVQWERNSRKYKRPDDSHLPQRKSSPKSTKEAQSAGSDTSRSEVRPKSSTTKYRKPDGIDSKIRDRSSKNTNEVRSTRSTTKYRRSNESGSSRSSSPKKINEVRPKSSPTKYKRPNETELSIRNALPKNMNEIQSKAGKINNLNPIGATSSKRGTLQYKRPVGSELERHRSLLTSTETSRRSISPKSNANQSIISVTVTNNKTDEKHHLTQRIPENTIMTSQSSSIRRSVSPSSIDETQSLCVCSPEQKKFTHEIEMLREKYSLNNSNKCNNPTCLANIERRTNETASKIKISSAAQNYRKIPQRSASQMSAPGFKLKDSLKLYESKKNISTKTKPFRVKSTRSDKSSEISIPTINLSKSKTNKKKSKNSISNSSRIKNKITPPKIIKENEYCSPTQSISQNRTNKIKIKMQKSTVSPAGSISPSSRQSARSQPRDKCPQINMNKIILELDDIKSQSFESKKGCHQSRICSVRENRCSQLRRTCCANRKQSTCTGARQISPCLTQKLTNQQILSKLNENVCNFYQAAIKNTCKAGVSPAQQRPCSAPNRTCKSPCRNVCNPTTPTKISTPSKLPSNNFTSNVAFIERPCSAPSKACRAITCKSSTPTDMKTRQVCCDQSRQVNSTRQCGCSRKQESLNQVKTNCCKKQSCNRQTYCKKDLIEPRLGIG